MARIVFSLVVVLFLGAALGVGWHFSNSVLSPQPYALMPEFELLAVAPEGEGEALVTLPEPVPARQFGDTRAEGRYGLVWEGGHGELGPVQAGAEGVVRALELHAGTLPSAGEPARMDAWVYRRNPEADLGLPFEALTLQGPVGALAAWWLPQEGERAVLLLHGRRRGDLAEGLRVLPTLAELGYSALLLSYRNHGSSDPSPDGFYHYGASEWQDALAGLEFLGQQGVTEVVLYGFSMGGAVALELLERLPQQAGPLPDVNALVLDSPLVDPRSVFVRGAQNMGLPLAEPLTGLALFVARLRSGVAWNDLDQRRTARTLGLPVLLFAGTEDSTVPIAVMDEFAREVPGVVYHRLDGAEHVEGWNRDPSAYEGALREFLGSLP